MDSKILIKIVGLIKDCSFHVAKTIAEVNKIPLVYFSSPVDLSPLPIHYACPQGLKQQFPEAFLDPEIRPLFEFEWHTYLCTKKQVGVCFVRATHY